MYFQFKRTRPGAYSCHYRYGYQAILVKMDGMWQGFIRDGDGNHVPDAFVCERTLKEAQNALAGKAVNITVDTVNLISRKPIEVSIATPASCDPSTETFHSM